MDEMLKFLINALFEGVPRISMISEPKLDQNVF